MKYAEQTINSLAEKAEVLVKARGYRVKKVEKNENYVDVISSIPKSKDKVLVRIVTESKLDSGTIGKQLVEEMQKSLEEEDCTKVVVIGKSFTSGARSGLRQNDIEFIANKGDPTNLLTSSKLYPRIQTAVNEICKTRCGKIPKSEKQCKGYNPNPKRCPTCDGTGIVKKRSRSNTCPDCKGRTVEPIYTCDIRLLSDNADFHLEKGWTALLQNDLEQALRIQSKIVSKQKLSEKILKVLNHD